MIHLLRSISRNPPLIPCFTYQPMPISCNHHKSSHHTTFRPNRPMQFISWCKIQYPFFAATEQNRAQTKFQRNDKIPRKSKCIQRPNLRIKVYLLAAYMLPGWVRAVHCKQQYQPRTNYTVKTFPPVKLVLFGGDPSLGVLRFPLLI